MRATDDLADDRQFCTEVGDAPRPVIEHGQQRIDITVTASGDNFSVTSWSWALMTWLGRTGMAAIFCRALLAS